MSETSNRSGVTRRAFTAGTIAVAAATAFAPRLRAAVPPLKIGVLLPRSGHMAFFGQSCQRGIDLAADVLPGLGYDVPFEIMNADFESNVNTARTQAERLIQEGANLLIGPFDSGAAAAIAQVAEQKGVPFVINVAAAPQITEQGYKYVFRNFPRAPELIKNGLTLMKDVISVTGAKPKTAVLMHVNDTFGVATKGAIDKIFPTLDMPFQLVEAISYDPAARDLSVEVSKAKSTNADIVMVVTRINDAITLVREIVKQRYEPMGIVSPGSPGMYEQQFFNTLAKYSDYCISNVPWYNPKAEMAVPVAEAFKRRWPNDALEGYIFNVGFSLEAVMVALDAYRRAGSTKGEALAEALRATDIKNHLMVGGPIRFDAKGQNDGIGSACLQNYGGRPRVVLPKEVAEAPPVFPMPGWSKRS